MNIGITGTIGSGKSSVKNILLNQGYYVFDSDLRVHSYYEKGAKMYQKSLELLGEEILDQDQEIDRLKIAELVFNNDKLLDELEKEIFPIIIEDIKKIIKSRSNELSFFEVPLLFESGMEGLFDAVIVIDAEEELRYERLEKRGLNNDQVRKREVRQMSFPEKRKLADYLILNNGSFSELENEVKEVLNIILLERAKQWFKKK